jgi:hypothetical protein
MNRQAKQFEAIGVLLLALLACASPKAENKNKPGPSMSLAVAYGTDGVAVKNFDAAKTYNNLELTLNVGYSGNDGEAGAGSLKPGKAVTVSYFNFINSDRRRFDIRTTALLTVFVKGQVDGQKATKLFLCPQIGRPCSAAPEH